MTRIIARNSAPRRTNSPAAEKKARIKNSTARTGFLAITTIKAENTAVAERM